MKRLALKLKYELTFWYTTVIVTLIFLVQLFDVFLR